MARILSSLPRKQRKAIYSKRLHERQKDVSAHLSGELAEKLGRRSLPIRKGDKAKVMRGDNKGTVAKVDEVDLSRARIYLEGVSVTKVNGAKVRIPLHPSNLMIMEFGTSDKRRFSESAKKSASVKEK